jgi:glycolate oxidase
MTMIDRDAVLRALQAIVGETHARGDRATLCNYGWNGGVGAMPGPKFIKNLPIAVVMPASAEQISAVIKLCLAKTLNYKASSTGNGSVHLTSSPNTVMIDMGRMDRIQIDAENQMAIIESGATAGRLQAEAMKHGLTCHIVGAGPSHSPLASATSFHGIGVTGSSTGHNSRNVLSLEWVSPQGDIVRIGCADDEWFSEEGPGPGFRGVIRGFVGAGGALGVFTRIGYKLYPWAGPAAITVAGKHPQIGMVLPDNMKFFLPVWPDAERMRDASFRLNRSGVPFAMLRMPPGHISWVLTASNAEYERRHQAGEMPACTEKDNRFAWQIVTIGHSPAHTAYQEKVVRHVVTETGGRFLDVQEADAQMLVRNIVTSIYVGRVFRGAASSGTSFGVAESFAIWPKAVEAAERLMEKQVHPGGAFASDSIEGFWAWPTESRQLWCENILAAKADTTSGVVEGLRAFLKHLYMMDKDPGFGMMGFLAGPLVDMYGPRLQHANTWMRRIKRMLDPQHAADPAFYVPRKNTLVSRAWPAIQRVLFSRLGEPILNAALRAVAKKSL